MVYGDPYETGMLTKDRHDRLVANLENYAKDAGIQPHWVWTPMEGKATADEKQYLIDFRQHSMRGTRSGLVYTGLNLDFDMTDHMSLVCGLLVRNFVRARVMTLGSVVAALQETSLPDLTCLLIPNFLWSKEDGGDLPRWQVNMVYDMLVDRHARGRQTILYVSRPTVLAKEYGLPMSQLVMNNYLAVPIAG